MNLLHNLFNMRNNKSSELTKNSEKQKTKRSSG